MRDTVRALKITEQATRRPLFTDEEREAVARAVQALREGKLFGPDGQRYPRGGER